MTVAPPANFEDLYCPHDVPRGEPCPVCAHPPGAGAGLHAGRARADRTATVEQEAPDLLAGLRDGAWLDAQDFPPLRFHVPGVLPEGATFLVGPPKIGKSWFVLAIGLAVAAGGRVLGQEVDRRPVLYLALEDGDRRLQDRCRMLLGPGERIPPAFEYLTAIQPGTVLATVTAWFERHPGAEPLVILDTLGKVMPPALIGESAYQRDYRVGGALKRLTDEQPGSALLINHHDRKAGSEDFVDRVSGTNGLAGSADSILVLARPRHDTTGALAVTGRDVPEGEYSLRFDGARGLWSLDGADLATAARKAEMRRASDGLDERSVAIVTYVTDHPGGVRAGDVADALSIDPAQARMYLSRLHESGRLARPTRGLYTPVASVAPVASDHDDATHATDATPLLVDDTEDR